MLPRTSATMRAFVALLVLLSVALAQASLDNGEPGCQTPAESGNAYRHFNDPTKYWLCSTPDGRPELRRCPDNRAFSQAQRACVPWQSWVWEPVQEPLSRPPDFVPDEPAVVFGAPVPQVVGHPA